MRDTDAKPNMTTKAEYEDQYPGTGYNETH